MFGKKLLSVVGLLFLGSQIISVEADCTPSLITDDDGNLVCKTDINDSSCGEGDNGRLFKLERGGNVYIVEVGGDGATCSSSTDANYCTTENGEIISTIVGFCKDVGGCKEGAPTYGCNESGVCTRDVVDSTCQKAKCLYDGNTNAGCGVGDFVVVTADGNGHTVILDDPSSVTHGVLYKCNSSNTCSIIDSGEFEVGYYKNAGSVNNKYIKCTAADDCLPVAVSEGSCTNENIGELILSGNEVSICLDEGVPFKLDEVEEKHFMNLNVSNNVPFTTVTGDKYGVVKVKETEVHMLKETITATTPAKMYKYTDAEYKIYDSRHADICVSGKKIVEFKLDSCPADGVTYYSLSRTHTWLPSA